MNERPREDAPSGEDAPDLPFLDDAYQPDDGEPGTGATDPATDASAPPDPPAGSATAAAGEPAGETAGEPAGETAGETAAADDEPDVPSGSHLLELWSDRPEMHALPEILRPAEGVVCVASGTVLRSGRLAKSNWLIVLTDRRLLCVKGRVDATRKVIEMPISAIRSVDKSGLWRKTLTLDTGYGTLKITGVKGNQATEMVEGLSSLMRTFRKGDDDEPAAVRKAAVPSGADADVARLEREVAALRERVIALEQARERKHAGGHAGDGTL